MSVLFRFNGQAAYEVDAGRVRKIRLVFGMIDEGRIAMAWYLFAGNGVAKSKRELAHPDPNHDPMPPEEFGFRGVGGRDIPHTFKKVIGLDELALHAHGTPATLELDTDGSKRFIGCRIDKLMTKAKEVVTFPFGLQTDTDRLSSKMGKFHGKVSFLEFAAFHRNEFPLGPKKHTLSFITGPGF